LTLNYKGLFVLALYVSEDGGRLFVQDQAIKFNDLQQAAVYRTDARQDDWFYEVLFGRLLPHLFSYISKTSEQV
jgi:hypothetical protein